MNIFCCDFGYLGIKTIAHLLFLFFYAQFYYYYFSIFFRDHSFYYFLYFVSKSFFTFLICAGIGEKYRTPRQRTMYMYEPCYNIFFVYFIYSHPLSCCCCFYADDIVFYMCMLVYMLVYWLEIFPFKLDTEHKLMKNLWFKW